MKDPKDIFSGDNVDEQIEQLLQGQGRRQIPGELLIRQLSRNYEEERRAVTLENAYRRITEQVKGQPHSDTNSNYGSEEG